MKKTFVMILVLLLSLTLFAQAPAKLEQPVLVSSAGQSADVTLASMLLKRAKIEYKTLPMAKDSDLEGVKTLMIVPGFSSKGLGAAGISREEELKRIANLVKVAKEKKMKILLVHIGGKARRGTQSDEFNKIAAESCHAMVVVAQGNEDGYFSTLAEKRAVPLYLVDKIALAVAPIDTLFH